MNWIVLVVLAQAQVAAPVPPVQKEPHRWEVFLGFQGGVRPDTLGGGGGAVLGVNRLFFNFLRPELALGLGAYSQPVDVLTLIRLGARFELPLSGRLRPFLGVYFAHQHESGWEHISQDPVPAIIGLSEHGVHHRSGLETALGLTYELFARKGLPVSGRLGLKAGVTHLLGEGPPRYVELTTLLGLCF